MKPLSLTILFAALCLGQTFVPGGSGVAAAEGTSPCNITVATANGNFSSVYGPHNNGLSPADSLQVWQANLSATDASDVIRVTVSSTANWNSCAVVQYSSNSDTTLDQIAVNDITGIIPTGSTIPTGTTPTTTSSNELLLEFYTIHPAAVGGTYSPIASWTLRESEAFQQANAVIVERIVSATGTYQAGVTYTANLSTGVGVILTFKAATAIKPRGQFARVQ